MQVLIVDDNRELRATLADGLSLCAWTSLQAENGTQALELFSAHHDQIDAVLLDYMMPAMDGLHVLPELLTRSADVPVIMMTSYGSIHLATEFMKNGGSGFIEKPITHYEVLKLRIEEAVQHAENRRALKNERAARQAYEQTNEAKDRFLANLSHELRTPLMAIFPFAALAKKKLHTNQPNEAITMLDRLLAGQERLIHFVTNMECLAQIYTGKLALHVTQEDLVRLTRDVLQRESLRFLKKNLRWHLSGVTTLLSHCDATHMRSVLEKVVHNAMKFSPEGGEIQVVVEEKSNVAQLTILDTGPGIPAGENEIIFHPFSEGCHTRSRASGTGLGLSVARGVMRLHGGEVYVTSRLEGKGTQVTLLLPFQQDRST